MEDVLEVYSRPYDAKHPVVCMDEKPVQLLAEAGDGFTSNSTGVRYEDNEYVRNGTCSIFLFTEPLAGWREAVAKQQRTRTDWAERIKWLLDERYPDVEQVVLVCDNLWVNLYQGIGRCNSALRALENVSESEFALKKERTAEMKFLRAQYYLRLKVVYYAVPWVDETMSQDDVLATSNVALSSDEFPGFMYKPWSNIPGRRNERNTTFT